MVPNPRLPKKYTKEGTQTKKKDPIRCKCAKCYNERYKHKTAECLKQHDRLHPSQYGKLQGEPK